uniref:Putative transposase n=1 Tax=Agrobacterium tumefaciens TaxID=358 RepID=A0A2P0QJT5_AGRTU|nr:putative transposase [Agrobacterium tumefaciens]
MSTTGGSACRTRSRKERYEGQLGKEKSSSSPVPTTAQIALRSCSP